MYQTIISKLTIVPEGQPLFCERAIEVSITDEGGGEFLVISQSPDKGLQEIRIDIPEWGYLKLAIEKMIKEIR